MRDIQDPVVFGEIVSDLIPAEAREALANPAIEASFLDGGSVVRIVLRWGEDGSRGSVATEVPVGNSLRRAKAGDAAALVDRFAGIVDGMIKAARESV